MSTHTLSHRPMIRCKDCHKQISAKVGTIFEDSPLSLQKWFVAIWAVANCKNGISSYELGRAIGVRQASAWHMLHRIRKAMEVGGFVKQDGDHEADTTYVGGKAANMHAKVRAKKITGRGAVNKTAVHGVLRRATGDEHSTVRATVIGSEDAERLMRDVRRNVRYGSRVFTDEAPAYADLAFTHVHQAIDHSRGYFLAPTLPWHRFTLYRYVSEQVFRYNNRKTDDGHRFQRVLAAVVGKQLTYRALTCQGDAGFMGLQ